MSELDYTDERSAKLVDKHFDEEEQAAMVFVAKQAAQHVMGKMLTEHEDGCQVRQDIDLLKSEINGGKWFMRGVSAAFGLVGAGVMFVGAKGVAALATWLKGQ